MKIIFSPSKEMKNEDIFFKTSKKFNIEYTSPIFSLYTNDILKKLNKFSKEDIEKIMKIKGSLLEETFNNIKNFKNEKSIPAIFLYNGIAFKELKLSKYSESSLEYMSDHLFILSAFYGISKPFTVIRKYRLDMTMKIFNNSLYSFWKKDINNFILEDFNKRNDTNHLIINLASKEFSKIIDKKFFSNIISIDFKEFKNNKYSSVSSYSKKARGKFLNIMIKNRITQLEDLKQIKFDGYSLNLSLSDEKNYIFSR